MVQEVTVHAVRARATDTSETGPDACPEDYVPTSNLLHARRTHPQKLSALIGEDFGTGTMSCFLPNCSLGRDSSTSAGLSLATP